MNPENFCSKLEALFPFEPTESQRLWFPKVAEFVVEQAKNTAFVLTGYAGTGKTTLIGTLLKHLKRSDFNAVLLAPTGRAAKVMATYSNYPAFTIHKKIYFPKSESGGGISFQLKQNKHKNTVFIVDEASMIGDDRKQAKLFENGALLLDLIHYVNGGNQCKLIFVGDPAQLPPVHLSLSPALDVDELKQFHFDKVYSIQLEEVVRQAIDSGILMNATQLREQLQMGVYDQFQFDVTGQKDVLYTNNGLDLTETIEDAYAQSGISETVFIVRSNKRANAYNNNIRTRILGLEEELAVGDQLMVVKNNYFWLDADSKPGFIANGDVIEVLSIHSRKELYGFSFAEVSVSMMDYPDEDPFETVLLLNTLSTDTPSLNYASANALYQAVLEDYAHEKPKYKRFLKVKNNPFFNALQVKYSYAITCHKSQGGQWDHVFVEKPYLADGPNEAYLRWLYTAITRAKKRLYLIGFPNEDLKGIE